MRNNCCSLLSQLLHEEADVSILRFIKRERPDLKSLIKKIAAKSGTDAKVLQELAKHDPSYKLDDIQLPPGEAATRGAIAATEKHELLGQTGDTFELTLLLTQAQALSYAWHLAEVAGNNEPEPGRARALAAVSLDMQDLHREVFALLLSNATASDPKKK